MSLILGPAHTAGIDKSPLPPINREAVDVPDNAELGFSRPKTSKVTRSPRKLPKLPDGAVPALPPAIEDAAEWPQVEEAGKADEGGGGGDDADKGDEAAAAGIIPLPRALKMSKLMA